ncbi:MAG: hypothetical protein EBV41_02685, partial [Actinobacteria bacterium]|nr:hypothetical protein [Actinomycetota bacterium]
GAAVADGVGLGHVVLHEPRVTIKQLIAEDPAREEARLDAALESVRHNIDLLVDRGLIKTSDFNVVWKSGQIPNSPVAVRKDLPADLFEILKKTILEKINKTAFVSMGLCENETTCNVTHVPACTASTDLS